MTVYSDSQYLVNAFNQNWVAGWLGRGWKNSQKQPVKNVDLRKRLLAAKAAPHREVRLGERDMQPRSRTSAATSFTTAADNPVCHQVDKGFRD